jgi:hypothetical protein
VIGRLALLATLLLGSACNAPGSRGEDSDALPKGVVAEMGSRRWHHESEVGRLAFSRGGAHLLSGGHESVRTWEASSGRLLNAIDRRPAPPSPLIEKQGVVEGVISSKGKWFSVAFSPDGSYAAIQENGILLWDLAARKQKATFDLGGSAGPAAFSPDGERLAAVSWDGVLHLIDLADGKEAAAFHVYDAELKGAVLCLEFSPDGSGSRRRT